MRPFILTVALLCSVLFVSAAAAGGFSLNIGRSFAPRQQVIVQRQFVQRQPVIVQQQRVFVQRQYVPQQRVFVQQQQQFHGQRSFGGSSFQSFGFGY
jgi:hypothetical protein